MIDEDENEIKNKKIKMIANKDKCLDIFHEKRIGNSKSASKKKFIRIKFQRAFKEALLKKINLIIGMKCISGVTFLKAMLKKIDLAKDLFILNI